MEKIYLISCDNLIDFVFTSKNKAFEQMEIIKNSILNGRWFMTGVNEYAPKENYIFCPDYSYSDKNEITYCFKNKLLNRYFTYHLFTKDINKQVY